MAALSISKFYHITIIITHAHQSNLEKALPRAASKAILSMVFQLSSDSSELGPGKENKNQIMFFFG